MTPLEKAARALHELNDRQSKPQFRCAWDDCLPEYHRMLIAEARVVFQSIEIDDAMEEAACSAWIESSMRAALKAFLRSLLEGETGK